MTDTTNLPPFKNEPFTDFSISETKRALAEAFARVRSELGHTYDLIIGGHRVREGATFTSTNPAKPDEIIGTHYAAEPALAERP